MSRLRRIVDAMGGVLLDGGRRALVRGPGHGPADRSVSLLETEDGRVLIHCFSPRDDWRAVRDEFADLGLLDEDDVLPLLKAWRHQGLRTALVTRGPYRAVRNPIFTFMVMALAGMALLVPNALTLLALVALVLAVELQVKVVEEPYLDRTHGEAYRRYRAGTWRFVPFVGR